MRNLHAAALVTTGAQETERERLHKALRLDSDWRYETDCVSEAERDRQVQQNNTIYWQFRGRRP